jgi:hypothetical protein
MSTIHRTAGVLLLAVALAVAPAGCTHPAGSAGGNGTGGTGTLSSGTTPAASTPTDTGTAGAAGTQGYPGDPSAYTKIAVNAWLGGDQTRLDQLRDPANTIFQRVGSGNYDRHYTFKNCQGAAGSSYCTFDNAVGDELILRVANPKLGGPHAIMDGQFNPITFPTDMRAYAQECLDAWKADNTARVEYLTTPDAKTHLYAVSASHRADDWTFVDSQGAAGSSYLTWHNPAGDRLVFRFHNPGVVPGEGPQHRIVDVLWNP